MSTSPPFAIYYAGDAYSTANKIMGRQSAGKAFMRGVARTWPKGDLHGLGQGSETAKAMYRQLGRDGFEGQLKWIEPPNWAALGDVGTLLPSDDANAWAAAIAATPVAAPAPTPAPSGKPAGAPPATRPKGA
jgi:hypothetical protein